MTNIKSIIADRRMGMEAAGLLTPVKPALVSLQTKAMRPSLTKLDRALQERPDRFSIVQLSPFSLLFDVILPKLEPLLIELGEAQAEGIITALCQHGQAMIEKYGLAAAKEHLEQLFLALPQLEAKLSEPGGIKEIISICESADFIHGPEEHLQICLGNKIDVWGPNKDEKIALTLGANVTDGDLLCLLRAKGIGRLDLSNTKITDQGVFFLSRLEDLRWLRLPPQIGNAGLAHLPGLKNLLTLIIHQCSVTDAGLALLSGLPQLQDLDLNMTRITDRGLAHLARFPGLKMIRVPNQITDEGLPHLYGLSQLVHLNLMFSNVTDRGIAKIKSVLPDLEIIKMRK